ncbi:MAG: hypothetical protein FWF56_03595 [Firmicutes bacterium]|nr:hypothetical protein [Bacillota bacterium]
MYCTRPHLYKPDTVLEYYFGDFRQARAFCEGEACSQSESERPICKTS